MLGFNDTSSLVGHFVSSPREKEKRDRRGDKREGQRRKRSRNESEEIKEEKNSPSTRSDKSKFQPLARHSTAS